MLPTGNGTESLRGYARSIESLLAAAEAMRRGVHDGVTLEFIGNALGPRAVDLGEMIEVSAETVSRWENGHRTAERSVWSTLADLVADELAGVTTTPDRLRGFAEHGHVLETDDLPDVHQAQGGT